MTTDSQPDGDARPASEDDAAHANEYWSQQAHALLRQVAQRQLRDERGSITLDPTDLVHEVYLRLESLRMPLANRQHFLRMAATTMRRILVDHARRKLSQKRGESPVQVTLRSDSIAELHDDGIKVVELDLLLTDLASVDQRKVRIAELHFFGGLTQDEVAAALAISTATVVRELRFVRSWIHAQMHGDAAVTRK